MVSVSPFSIFFSFFFFLYGFISIQSKKGKGQQQTYGCDREVVYASEFGGGGGGGFFIAFLQFSMIHVVVGSRVFDPVH